MRTSTLGGTQAQNQEECVILMLTPDFWLLASFSTVPMIYLYLVNMKKPLFLYLTLFLLSACSISHITKGKVSRNQELIGETAEIILEKKITRLNIDTLRDAGLRKRLKKLNAWNVEVSRQGKAEFDSVVVFSRPGFAFSSEQIIYDFARQKRNLDTTKNGLVPVSDRIYYREIVWIIS